VCNGEATGDSCLCNADLDCDRAKVGLSRGKGVSFDFRYFGIIASGRSVYTFLNNEVRDLRGALTESVLLQAKETYYAN
jgi:hypothetical protein